MDNPSGSDDLTARFVRYASMDTSSREDSSTSPTTAVQMEFQKALAEELEDIGLTDIYLSEFGVLYASLPGPSNGPVIGLVAHVDTSPDAPGSNVRPQLHENWDGSPIELSDGQVVDPSESVAMAEYAGDTIITSDGTTLLGADDKAGVAIIVTACERLLADPSLPRPPIRVAFTPDEEIGRGVDNFEVDRFGADFAYTVDGGPLGIIDSQTFNAYRVDWTIAGKQVHPGSAKGVMVNALRIACDLVSMLRGEEMPESTEGMEGYVYPVELHGSCGKATLRTIVRDFTSKGMESRLAALRAIGDALRQVFPGAEIISEFTEQYRNPGDVIASDRRLIEHAVKGSRAVGVDAEEGAIRGGTDGSRLSYKGVPTANLPTGGEFYHSRREWIAAGAMERSLAALLKTLAGWAKEEGTGREGSISPS